MQLFSKKQILEKTKKFLLEKNKAKVIEILGATGSGKTNFSIFLANWVKKNFDKNCEIISVDSRQVYKNINISSAKIKKKEMQNIPHHGINICSPEKNFSVYDFQHYAFSVIEKILQKNNIPILCGGTMLWLDAVSENYLFDKNKEKKSQKKLSPKYDFFKIGIHWSRKILYERINKRAVEQFKNGLIEETEKNLKKYKITKTALTSFGYLEIQKYLEKKITYEEALATNQKRNRNYAKRQLTWWRGRDDIFWLSGEDI